MLKKLIAGGAVVGAALLYVVFGNRNSGSGGTVDAATAGVTATPSQQESPTQATAQTISSGSNPLPANSTNANTTASSSGTNAASQGQYKNGAYRGSVADATYGLVQVEAVVSGGKLTNVKLLQYPDGGGHTSEVSQFALPQLVEEAISAQSAQVDIVSGATQTSEAFQESLSAALQEAQA